MTSSVVTAGDRVYHRGALPETLVPRPILQLRPRDGLALFDAGGVLWHDDAFDAVRWPDYLVIAAVCAAGLRAIVVSGTPTPVLLASGNPRLDRAILERAGAELAGWPITEEAEGSGAPAPKEQP